MKLKIIISFVLLINGILCIFYGLGYNIFSDISLNQIKETKPLISSSVEFKKESISPKDFSTITGISYREILKINPDINNLLSFKNLYKGKDINYPIAQEKEVGKYFYGDHNYKKEYDELGTIFKPALPKGTENAFELLLGHRADGYYSEKPLMFSHLPIQFKTPDSNGSKSKIIYYNKYEPKEYKAVMTLDLVPTDILYVLPYNKGTEDYRNLIEHLNNYSSNWKIDNLTEEDNLLILSTCQIEKIEKTRFVVILKEVKDS